MIRVGVVGEDPNDTHAIQLLLTARFGRVASFFSICRRLKGGQLDSVKFFKMVELEAKSNRCDVIVCVRDLDAFLSENHKVRARSAWFENIRKCTKPSCSVLLLNVWELEAMLFADVDVVNGYYGSSIKFSGDPSRIQNPKERLRTETRNCKKRYVESDCRELFKAVSYDKVYQHCVFFRDFIENFKAAHKALSAIS